MTVSTLQKAQAFVQGFKQSIGLAPKPEKMTKEESQECLGLIGKLAIDSTLSIFGVKKP